LATAIQKETLCALLWVALLNLAYGVKARREERFLRAELDDAVYDAYARKTRCWCRSCISSRAMAQFIYMN
jgi:protein-S-isoprenylcysteine O-methyltransferase Ste14